MSNGRTPLIGAARSCTHVQVTAGRQLTLSIVADAPGRALGRRGEVELVEMPCRSVLNWVEGARMSDFYSANPYRGCELGCVYCYARYTHDFLELRAPEDFERRVHVKTNAAEVFARDLKRAPRLACGIHLGSATDPYQPAEARFGLTRRMLEKLLPFRGVPLSIGTKSPLVVRDLDLLAELGRRHPIKVAMTCVTLDPALGRSLEPHAPSTEKRLETLARLSARGIATCLMLAPVLPGINDAEADLTALLRRAREAGVGSMMWQRLFLPAASRRRFFPWLKERFPELVERYERAYRSGRELQGPYRDALRARVARARAAAGFGE